MQPAANTAVPDVKRTKARFVVSESSYSYMPTNTKRKGQLNTEIAKGHRQGKRERERESTRTTNYRKLKRVSQIFTHLKLKI